MWKREYENLDGVKMDVPLIESTIVIIASRNAAPSLRWRQLEFLITPVYFSITPPLLEHMTPVTFLSFIK